LRDRAIALGWPIEQIVVIDSDLGKSGASSEDRKGFKKLVSEVGMGNAGIVIGLEVSRLARNSSDWHKLLEICALSKVLILDEDGLYDPGHFNDRLLLGLKGTMSEAELHVLKARLQGGIFSKARRGELKTPLPVGLVYDASNKVILDPDKQIRKSINFFFDTFQRTGSATGTVKYFRENGIKFPRKLRKGPNKGDVIWGDLVHHRTLQILHSPRYAGAFCFGQTRTRKLADGTTKYEKLPRDQWHTILKDVHAGYISWERHEENLLRLRENAHANGCDRRKSPPREGPALLQGLVICGVCGLRMTIRYHTRNGHRIPDYVCQRQRIEHSKPTCQHINGEPVDKAIGGLLIEWVSPLALEVAISVQDELKSRADEVDRLRKQQVERARYEADLARRRYMQVDPENRLVVDTLEAEWNKKLRVLTEAQDEYKRQCEADRMILNSDERSRIMSLATDFPKLWHDPKTQDREKKRMVRLLLEDVTLVKDSGITMHIRFKGGPSKTINLSAPMNAWQLRKTSKGIVSQIDRLLDQYTDGEIADVLNDKNSVSGTGRPFSARMVAGIRRKYGIKSRFERLREQKLFTISEISDSLKISKATVKNWAKNNTLKSYKYNDKNERLYQRPGQELINKLRDEKRQGRSQHLIKLLSNRINEVQYEV
jgi:DNA invertase Pin-like site-specific DNA recombinase